jgi:hypothetical protein
MTAIAGQISHDLEVTSDLEVSGQVNGKITVRAGGQLTLAGQCNGDVDVLDGASLYQQGQLNGTLTCMGWADISGQVHDVVVPEGGVVLVAEGSQRKDGGQWLVLDATGAWVPRGSGVLTVTGDAPRWRWNPDGSMTPTG